MEKNLKQLFKKLNEQTTYVYFRDAKYLSDIKNDDDIDILIRREDVGALIKIMYEHDYITFQKITRYTRKIGFFHMQREFPTFDVQIDHIHKLRYLSGSELLAHRKIENGIYVFEDTYKLLVLVLKDLFLISFFGTKKYSSSKINEIKKLYAKNNCKLFLKKKLKNYFGSSCKPIIEDLENNTIAHIQKYKLSLMVAMLFRTQLIILFPYNLWDNWTRNKNITSTVVTILGVDGSGKSTLVNNLAKAFEIGNISSSQIYMGRWIRTRSVKQLTNISNKKYKGKKPFYIILGRDILYTMRYVFLYMQILWKRITHRYILTDRYAYDLLTQKDTMSFLSFFVRYMYPKPTLTFLLYNDAKIIFKRKQEQTIEKLTHHQNVLAKQTAINKGYFVKSNNERESFNEVLATLLFHHHEYYSFLKTKVKKLKKIT